MLERAACSAEFGRRERGVAFDCYAVGPLDGAQAGGYSGFAGGDGLAVAAAVGAFGQAVAKLLDFADVGFALVGVRGDGEDRGIGGRGIQDEADGLAFGVPVGQGDDLGPSVSGQACSGRVRPCLARLWSSASIRSARSSWSQAAPKFSPIGPRWTPRPMQYSMSLAAWEWSG